MPPPVLGRVLVAASLVAGLHSAIHANCQNEGPYEIRQCIRSTWFAPVSGNGAITTVQWWAVGFGNATEHYSTSAIVSPEGSGFLSAPLPGRFIGIDSGVSTRSDLDLVDASSVPGVGAPPGATCFSSGSNWGSPTTDSCIDVNRTATAGGGSSSLSDSYLNIYWSTNYGPYYGPYYTNQLDPPMGVLLKESTGTKFALAFFASVPRPHAPGIQDITAGEFSMDKLTNGDPGVTGNNVVPWQDIPQPGIRTSAQDPNNPSTTFDVTMTWSLPRLIHDGSHRPCLLLDGVTPCPSVVGGGVGVLDQGPLIHFEIQLTGLDALGICSSTWTTVAGSRVDYPATITTGLGVPRNSCVRLRTVFGRTPLQALRLAPTTANRDANRLDAQTGRLGDIGYDVTSAAASLPCWIDIDGDGYSGCSGDCDDTRGTVYPGAPQICGDGLNNDCGHPNWPSLAGTNEMDDDGDGFTECAGDCADGDASIFPGAPQICDGKNNDCRSPSWPGLIGTNEKDDDGDGFSECAGDCADSSATTYPGAPQICDGLNNNCLDPSWPALPVAERDADGDGYMICQGDCDDSRAALHPGAVEICNGIDDNCNGAIDDDPLGVDSDGDAIHNACDNCRSAYNPSQADTDKDGRGNACDNCLTLYNPGQEDSDSDQRGNICDNCPTEFNPFQDDTDADNVGDVCDNCIFDRNTDQADFDHDYEGDACDLDDGLILLDLLSYSDVRYQEESGYSSFNIYRGDLGVLKAARVYTQDPSLVPAAGQFCSETGGVLYDPETPSPGAVLFYLVTGMNGGGESSLGTDSGGNAEPNDNPCP